MWYVFLTDQEYPASRQAEVYHLSNLINEAIVVGSVVTREDGSILFRNTFDQRDIQPSIEALTRFFSAAAFGIGLWENAYQKLSAGKGTPPDCLNAAMIEMNASDSTVVSKGTRKALLAVENGGMRAASELDGQIQRNLKVVLTELQL